MFPETYIKEWTDNTVDRKNTSNSRQNITQKTRFSNTSPTKNGDAFGCSGRESKQMEYLMSNEHYFCYILGKKTQ